MLMIYQNIRRLISFYDLESLKRQMFSMSYDLHIVSMQLFVILFNVVYSRNQELTFQPHFVQNL